MPIGFIKFIGDCNGGDEEPGPTSLTMDRTDITMDRDDITFDMTEF